MNRNIYDQRIRKLQKAMSSKAIDISLLLDRENLIYFGGIEQVECMAIVVPQKGEPVGITLWLDLDFIRDNCEIDDVRPYMFPHQSMTGEIAKIIREMGYQDPVIGFERYFVSYSVFDQLRQEFDVNKFTNIDDIVYKLRSIKTIEEIQLIKKASKAVCAGMEAAINAASIGVKELDIAAEAEYASMKAGSQGTPFRPQVVSGVRTLTTHPFASEKVIENGEILLIHIGAKVGGYVAKMCRTIIIGDAPQKQKDIYEVIRKSQKAAMSMLKPGATVHEVCMTARDVVDQAGYNKNFLNIIGYGMGLRQSEFYPILSLNNNTVLEENMVVDVLLPTIYVKDLGGPRLTDTILINKEGAIKLTDYPDELILK